MKKVTDCSDMSTDSKDSTSDPPRHEDIPPGALKHKLCKEELKKRWKLTVVLKKVLLERLELAFKNKLTLAATNANKKQVGNKMNGF